MRLHTLLGRFALPLVLTTLATAGAGLPAYADDPIPADPGGMFINVPERVVAVDGKSKTIEADLVYIGEEKAKDVTVSFGDQVPASIGLSTPKDCTGNVCPIGDLDANGTAVKFSFTVSPTADLPKLGETLTIVAKDSTGTLAAAAKVQIISTRTGIDLELNPIKDMKLAPGKSADVPIVIRNTGNKTAEGVGVVLVGADFISFPAKYTNCEQVDELEGTVCLFDQPIEGDQIFTLSDKTPMKVKVAADAPGPGLYGVGAFALALNDLDELGLDSAAKAAESTSAGTKLKLEPLAQARALAGNNDIDENELNEWDNAASFLITVGRNPADSVALGATFTGGIGDKRTIKVGIRNDGPAATASIMQGWLSTAEIKLPAGIDPTEIDPSCEKMADHVYLCLVFESLHKGEQQFFSFSGTVEGTSKPGSITIEPGPQDTKASNNTAAIEVKLSTGGEGGGLPVTGAPTGFVLGGGAALLLAGGVLFYVARRRRIVTVA
ncbi:hypothetical protein [Winogradskya humida]|uniref:LPXTG-motif cell wall-anchored protein n=1 Tax=Winogradskya humida TaxID=113566 RepID=A0ABQ3ZM81_9ACTN|nr:hypothetical protein [Actinoplanes humidus]GIE19604.1 hypothetical protein Ahu01nite_027060 [Actinoplanes humidus]